MKDYILISLHFITEGRTCVIMGSNMSVHRRVRRTFFQPGPTCQSRRTAKTYQNADGMA
jgi:hypothetical protein